MNEDTLKEIRALLESAQYYDTVEAFVIDSDVYERILTLLG